MIGRPSDQPRAITASCNARGSEGSASRSAGSPRVGRTAGAAPSLAALSPLVAVSSRSTSGMAGVARPPTAEGGMPPSGCGTVT